MVALETAVCKIDAVPTAPGRHCRVIQDNDPVSSSQCGDLASCGQITLFDE